MTNSNNDVRQELYRQAWQQARHNETLRGAFGGVYAAISGGLLALALNNDDTAPFLYGFVAVLSFVGLLLSLRLAANAKRWTRVQKKIQAAPGANLPQGMDPKNVAPPRGWEKITEWFRADVLFPFLYLALTIAFAVFAIVSACTN